MDLKTSLNNELAGIRECLDSAIDYMDGGWWEEIENELSLLHNRLSRARGSVSALRAHDEKGV